MLKEFIKETLCVSDFNITDFDVVDKIDESALKLRDKINNDNETCFFDNGSWQKNTTKRTLKTLS